ncbi:MAG: hypothetical protein HOP30_01030 [Cyclobacteriaceae bacterium]|nr:hypothetical protein [Cyclobacteriaceae bacterium]
MKKILSLLLMVCTLSAFAQDEIDNLIKGTKADATYLVTGYAAPALNAISAGLNQGWYNTAAPHKLFGFDLTLTASPVFLSSSDLTYTVNNANLTNVKLVSVGSTAVSPTGSAEVPTVFGDDIKPRYQGYSNGFPTGQPFDGAPGLNLDIPVVGSASPMAMVQLGLGLPKGTDLKFRFFPSTKIGDGGNVSMFGIGVMHDIKQYIPGVKSLPFDLSGFFGYTSLKLDVGLDTSDPGKRAVFETTAMTVQGLISKKISVLTLYGSVGYNFNSSSLGVKGTYTSNSVTLVDPIDISASPSGARLTAGLRLKFAIFTFHGDYTLQKYNSLSVGFGFNVR